MSDAAERATQLDLVARLKSSYPELPDAPTPDLLDHHRITAYIKPVHDVGGEPDAPMKYENKQYEQWEEDDLRHLRSPRLARHLAVRGTPANGQRRRRVAPNIWAAVLRALAAGGRAGAGRETPHRPDRAERAHGRGPGSDTQAGSTARNWRPSRSPKATDRGSSATATPSTRSARAIRRCMPGKAGTPKFKVGDAVVVRELPVLFYTRTPEYVRGATGEIERWRTKAPPPRTRRGTRPTQAEWFYVVRFNMAELWDGYNGTRQRHSPPKFPSTGSQAAE